MARRAGITVLVLAVAVLTFEAHGYKLCDIIKAPGARISVHSDLTALSLFWNVDNGRPTGRGWITHWDSVNGVLTGHMIFPDDAKVGYDFKYVIEDSAIYWDGDKDTTDNVWIAKCIHMSM